MKIENGTFVTIAYTMRLNDGEGEVVERSTAEEPVTFVTGLGQMMPGIEKKLLGMESGQQASFVVEPDDAYGQRRPELKDDIPRDRFPGDVEVKPGMVFHAGTPHGVMRMTVIECSDATVSVDYNHPLAGQQLHFDIDVLEARAATDDELASCCGHGSCGDHGCGEGCGDHGCGDDHGDDHGDGHSHGHGHGGCCG